MSVPKAGYSPEQIARRTAWYAAHREEKRLYDKARHDRSREAWNEAASAYYAANRQEVLERKRRAYRDRTAEQRERDRAYQRAYHKVYQETHRAELLLKRRDRHAQGLYLCGEWVKLADLPEDLQEAARLIQETRRELRIGRPRKGEPK